MKLQRLIFLALAVALIASLFGCNPAQESAAPSFTPSPSAVEPTPNLKSEPEYHSTAKIRERGALTVGAVANSSVDYLIPDDPEAYGELAGTRAGSVTGQSPRAATRSQTRITPATG